MLDFDCRHLTLHVPSLPSQIQRIIDQQLLPLTGLMQYKMHIVVRRSDGTTNDCARKNFVDVMYDQKAHEADTIIQLVQHYNSLGLNMEGTIVCMYFGYDVEIIAHYDPTIGTPLQWLRERQGLTGSGWENDKYGLERMRLVRTIHYINHRACLG